MRVDSFSATADLVGRRVVLRWTLRPEPGEPAAASPRVTVRRKRRDFAFPPPAPGDPYLLYDSAAFPPAPVPGVLAVVDLPDRDTTDGALRIREQTVTVAELSAGQPREVLRRTLRTVFAADRSVLRREVELLDVGGIGAGPLDPLVPYYYQLDSPAPPDSPDRLRATAAAGEAHGHHRTLYELIPEVYRRHDTVARAPDAGTGLLPEASVAGGQLRRFVDTFGAALDSMRSSADGLRTLRDVAGVDARFLPLVAGWIGWDLSADEDIARQRNEIGTAPRLYAAVGTVPGLRSVVDHYTGWSTRIAEFAQHVARAGTPPQRNVFAAVERGGAWSGADDAAAVLGFAAPNGSAQGAEGTAAELTGTASEPFALRPAMSLTVAVDGGLPATLTFGPADFADLGAATAAEVAAVVNAVMGDLRAEPAAGAVRLRSRLRGAASRLDVAASPASLVSLDGAPRGRLATAADAADRLWVAHATTVGAGGVLPRVHVKAHLRGRWYDTQPVEAQPATAQADPALVALPDGRLWLAAVDQPGTAAARLRWRRGRPGALTPARLRGERAGPFRLVAGAVLALSGHDAAAPFTETFTVHAADYADLTAATAAEVAAAMNGQLTGVTAGADTDGSLVLRTAAAGPGVRLRVDLAASTTARALGFGDRRLAGAGGWDDRVAWDPAATGPGPAGRHAQCTAAVDPQGAVRLVWSTHTEGAWRLARARWDGRLLVATGAGVGVLGDDGAWSAVTAADGLPGDDVRDVAVDADGSTWYATALGAAVRRPDGTVSALTTASTGGGLASDDIRAVAAAPDGTVWFAHDAGASARGADGSWRSLTAAGGLASDDVRHVLAAGGAVWFATAAGLTRFDPGGLARTLTVADGLPSDDVRHAAASEDGTVWVATAAGPARVGPDGSVGGPVGTGVSGVSGGLSGLGPGASDVRAVAASGASDPVWLATAAGLVELRAGRDPVPHTTAEGLPSDDCRAVLVAPDGTVWAGTPVGLARSLPPPAPGAPAGWQHVTTADGLVGDAVRAVHGPWSAPALFDPAGAGERDPHLVREGSRLWLAWSERQQAADPSDRWLVRLRRFDWPGPSWSAPLAATAPAPRATDREPALLPLGGGAVRLYFRSSRGGGPRLWSVDVDAGGAAGTPAPVTATPAADSDPAVVAMPGGERWLLFRSDRNVALGRLGGGVPGAGDAEASRRAPEEAAVRRFAGSVAALLDDLDRNRGRRGFGDLLDYTPQQPRGGPLAPDDLYTPTTVGLYVERGPAGRPLVRRDADRLRQLLDRFLPVNLRAVIVLRSAAFDEIVFGPGHDLTDAHADQFPFAEVVHGVTGVTEQTAVALPGWLVFLASDGTSVTVDPTQPTTARRRTWSPPAQ